MLIHTLAYKHTHTTQQSNIAKLFIFNFHAFSYVLCAAIWLPTLIWSRFPPLHYAWTWNGFIHFFLHLRPIRTWENFAIVLFLHIITMLVCCLLVLVCMLTCLNTFLRTELPHLILLCESDLGKTS